MASIKAQYWVANRIEEMGYLIEKSGEIALHYYILAANQGNLPSIKKAFHAYYNGKYIKQSYEEAVKYFKLGAELKDAECQYELGLYYLRGLGNIPLSFSEALKYFNLSSSQNYIREFNTLKTHIYKLIPP